MRIVYSWGLIPLRVKSDKWSDIIYVLFVNCTGRWFQLPTKVFWIIPALMPQSHPTTGPVRFLSPVRFLARKAEWSARRNFMPVLSPWSHQATGPVRLDTSVYLWFGWKMCRTQWVPRAIAVRALTGPARESSMFFISYGARTGPVRNPQWCRTAPLRARKGIDTTTIGKNPARASYLAVRVPYGSLMVPARAVHGLFTFSQPVRGP